MEHAEERTKHGLSRRQTLGLGAALLALGALASLPLRGLSPFRRARDTRLEGIPGEGSIFQPSPQALEDFLRRSQ